MSGAVEPADKKRHTLADWLTLHELDRETCRRILDTIGAERAGEPPAPRGPHQRYYPLELQEAWQKTLEAIQRFLPAHQAIITDTFDNTTKVVVPRKDNSRKALTLDNGAAAYPTIVFSYCREPIDALILAHEFGHALQIRASQGAFVSPVVREICAFLGEGAFLAHLRDRDPGQYPHFAKAWQADSDRYLGVQTARLKSALADLDAPYKYSWNYPIARKLAIDIARQPTPEWIWTVFQGQASVAAILRELTPASW